MKKEFCDRCKHETSWPHKIDLPQEHLDSFGWGGNEYYDLCKDCVKIIRKVIKKECSIIVGEVANS